MSCPRQFSSRFKRRGRYFSDVAVASFPLRSIHAITPASSAVSFFPVQSTSINACASCWVDPTFCSSAGMAFFSMSSPLASTGFSTCVEVKWGAGGEGVSIP